MWMSKVWTSAVLLILVTVSFAADRKKGGESIFKRFVGTWRLVSSVETWPDGSTRPYGFGPKPVGYLMYDAAGHMCAQVANSERTKWMDTDHPTPEELRAAFDGFGGYCGTYTVDEANGTMSHIPEVAFDPDAPGRPSPRSFKFEDGKLIYSGTEQRDTDDHKQVKVKWQMVWEKIN